MMVTRSSGAPMAAAASRSTGSSAMRSSHVRSASVPSGRTTPIVASSGSWSTPGRKRSRKPSSSTMASFASQWLDQVLDLVGRRGVVDRHRRGARPAARPGRARGTRGCCASSARPGRPCRRPAAVRPAAARPTRSASSAKVHSFHCSPTFQRRATRSGMRRRCPGTAMATVCPAISASMSALVVISAPWVDVVGPQDGRRCQGLLSSRAPGPGLRAASDPGSSGCDASPARPDS